MASSELRTESARLQVAALATILAGLVLAVASFLPTFQSGGERWTNDRAREYQDAALEIQNLSHHAASQTPDTATRADAEKLDRALSHFQDLQQELDDARTQSASLAVLMRALGVVLLIGGVFFYYGMRKASAELDDQASASYSATRR